MLPKETIWNRNNTFENPISASSVTIFCRENNEYFVHPCVSSINTYRNYIGQFSHWAFFNSVGFMPYKLFVNCYVMRFLALLFYFISTYLFIYLFVLQNANNNLTM